MFNILLSICFYFSQLKRYIFRERMEWGRWDEGAEWWVMSQDCLEALLSNSDCNGKRSPPRYLNWKWKGCASANNSPKCGGWREAGRPGKGCEHNLDGGLEEMPVSKGSLGQGARSGAWLGAGERAMRQPVFPKTLCVLVRMRMCTQACDSTVPFAGLPLCLVGRPWPCPGWDHDL